MFDLFIIICIILFAFILYRYRYWNRKGVEQYPFWKIWLQNVCHFVTQPPLTDAMVEIHKDFKDARYVGTYENFVPRLCIKDPDLIRQILVKDFDYFTDHTTFIPYDGDPVWENSLFNLKGDKWMHLRGIASPIFTSSKMKLMFKTILECSNELVSFLKKSRAGIARFDAKKLFGRVTTDVYFGTYFGIICNSLKDQNNQFYAIALRATNFLGFWFKMRFLIILFFPKIAKILDMKVFDQHVINFFKLLVKNNIELRKLKKIVRPDMIDLLIKSENNSHTEMTDDILTALAATFFGAGFDTVSTLLMYATYELSCNPTVQERLQNEIDEHQTDTTYRTVMEMNYLDMIISETLRKWPVAFFLERCCVKPYTIPPLNKGEVEILLKEGDQIWIPLYALQRESRWFSDPDDFDPERFSLENKGDINSYTYMPFGTGPRHCIGSRYALLVVKVILLQIFRYYTVRPTENVSRLKLARSYFQLLPKEKILLEFYERENYN